MATARHQPEGVLVEQLDELRRCQDPIALGDELTDLFPVCVVGEKYPNAITAASRGELRLTNRQQRLAIVWVGTQHEPARGARRFGLRRHQQAERPPADSNEYAVDLASIRDSSTPAVTSGSPRQSVRTRSSMPCGISTGALARAARRGGDEPRSLDCRTGDLPAERSSDRRSDCGGAAVRARAYEAQLVECRAVSEPCSEICIRRSSGSRPSISSALSPSEQRRTGSCSFRRPGRSGSWRARRAQRRDVSRFVRPEVRPELWAAISKRWRSVQQLASRGSMTTSEVIRSLRRAVAGLGPDEPQGPLGRHGAVTGDARRDCPSDERQFLNRR